VPISAKLADPAEDGHGASRIHTPGIERDMSMGDARNINGNAVGSGFPAAQDDDRPTFAATAAKQGLDWRCGTSVLVVAGDVSMRRFLANSLIPRFALVESAEDTVTAEALLARCHFDLLISAIRLPERPAPEWVRELRSRGDTTDVLYVADDDDREQAARAANDACSCLIFRPFGPEQLVIAARRCTKRRNSLATHQIDPQQIHRHRARDLIIGECPEIRELCATIERVAPRRSTRL